MAICGPYIHTIDPIILTIGGVHIWWYGASFTLGFIGIHQWMRRSRAALGYDVRTAVALCIMLAAGVLIGARTVEVIFYEWKYYGANPLYIPALWLGGMSTHGILLGAVLGIVLFCRRYGKPFIPLADTLAIAAAYIMGIGRIGNFIDGQIAGAVTTVCWGVQFPDLEGFRHPVVLYDGIKNLLLVPVLLLLRRYNPPPGAIFGHFILWYGFLRIFVDLFREYRVDLVGFPPGQEFNLLMTFIGIIILWRAYRSRAKAAAVDAAPVADSAADVQEEAGMTWRQRFIWTILLLTPLLMPSDWTQDVPARYGERHPGLTHSWLYPEISGHKGELE